MKNTQQVDIFDICFALFFGLYKKLVKRFSKEKLRLYFRSFALFFVISAILFNGFYIPLLPEKYNPLKEPESALAHYTFSPVSGTLVTGTEVAVNGAVAATAEGANAGSWKGAITDENFHWMVTSTAGGLNAQLDVGGVTLNGANKFIIQTAVDTDAAYNIKFQICDWTSATSVDAVADAQCTGGGWRTLNTQTAANADLNFATAATTNDVSLQWHIYNGYFNTGSTGGSSLDTPLTNFVNGSTKTIKIRYFTATNGGTLAIDFLRIMALVDPTYHPAGFVPITGGTVAGTYTNANIYGNTATAALAGGDNVHLAVPGTAGAISDSYLVYKNIKTYVGMNTIYVRGEYGCSAATANLRYTFSIRNFNTNSWENLGQPIDCAASNTDVVVPQTKNNVTISDYINGSSEIWIRKYGSINSTTALRTDWQYVTLGTTNTDTGNCDLNFGTQTGGRVFSDPAPNNTDNVNATVTDSSYIYVGGTATVNQDGEWRIEKRDITTGALVTAFDTDGIIQTDPGTGADVVNALAVDSSYLYVAGYQNNGNDDWRVEKRDKTTGALVTAFDTDGIIATNNSPSANQDRIFGLYINATHIFLVGEDGTTSTADRRWRIEKRDITTGALVTAFDTDGILNTLNPSTGADIATAITGDASYIYIVGTDVTTGTTGQWRIEKRDITTGALVTAFDTDGIVQVDPNTGASEQALAVAVNATHIYIGGFDRAAAATNDQWRVEKRDITTGALVTAFDTDGILNIAPSANLDQVTALALDSTDIYIIGEDRTEASATARWRVEKRALSNGALTTAFDGDGIFYSQYNGMDRPAAVSLQGTSLIIGGQGGGNSAAWMIEKIGASTGLPDTSFNNLDCSATRDLNLTTAPNIFRIQSEDESATTNNDFYPQSSEGTPDTTAEEAAAMSMEFSVTVPSNGQVAGIYYSVAYNGGSGLTMQTAMRDYSGRQAGNTGGWVPMGSTATVSMVQTEPLITGGFTSTNAAGYMTTDPGAYIDTVNGKMAMNLRTNVPAANNTNPVADIDFAMVSFSWIEDANHPTTSYMFTPTSGTLQTGTSGARNSILAAAAGGSSNGSWRGTLADDNFHWTATGTAGGIDLQLNLDGTQLNSANTMIIDSEVDLDAAVALKIQICDWVSSTGVDAAADANCTGGGWRSINTQDQSNADVGLTTVTTPVGLTWAIYNGYFTTGTAGGTAIDTPLNYFIKNDSTKRVKIRYYSTTASAVVDVDYLRVRFINDSIYSAGGFVPVTGGAVTGTYVNTDIIGHGTTTQLLGTGDGNNYKINMAANAGAANEGYFVFKNIKTLSSMNTVLVRMEYQCGSTTGTITPRIRNFSNSSWESLPASAIACVAADTVNGWAKNNVTLSNYINGSNEVWIDIVHNTANQSLAIDYVYVMLGSTNTDSAACQITLGTGTATNCANTRTLDMTGSASTFDNPSELESTNMGTGDSNAYYPYDNEGTPDANADNVTASNITVPMTFGAGTSPAGYHYAARITSGHASASVQIGLKDYTALNAALGGWVQQGTAAANSATYTDPLSNSTYVNAYGFHINAEDYVNTTDNIMNVRLRTTTNTTLTATYTTLWDFIMVAPQWVEISSSITVSGTIFAADDSTQLNAYSSAVKLVVGPGTAYTTTASSGTFSFGTVTAPSAGTVMTIFLDSGGATQGATVVKYGSGCIGTPNCTGLRIMAGALYLSSKDASNITTTDLSACDFDAGACSGDSDVDFDVNAGALSVTYPVTKVATGTTFAPTGAVSLNTLNLAGTYTAPAAGDLTITNDFINNGTFTHGNGTVVISPQNATPSVLNGSNNMSFYNLTMTNGDRQIKVATGKNISVSNNLNINGTSAQPIQLMGTTAGQQWSITFTGSTANVTFATIADSACSSSNDINVDFSTLDFGTNGACWKFKPRGGGGSNVPPPEGGGAGGGGSSCAPPNATAVLTSDVVTSVTVNSGGSCFVVPPTVIFVGGGGGGAVATAVVSGGAVTTVNMVAGGSGYSTAPTVMFSGGGNQGGGGSGEGGGSGGSGGVGGSSNTGAVSPGTLANDATVGSFAWTNPGNASASDNVYATISVPGTTTTNYLKATNFGFNIPVGAIITGVVAEFERKKGAVIQDAADSTIKLVLAGTPSGNNLSSGATWGTSDVYGSVGSSTNLWGLSLTPSDINSSNFGVAISAILDQGNNGTTASIDHIRMTIYYNTSSQGGGGGGASP